MSVIGTSSIAARLYGGVQHGGPAAGTGVQNVKAPTNRPTEAGKGFELPGNATPRGDWVLSENANPQNFDAGAPRGTYLNLVV